MFESYSLFPSPLSDLLFQTFFLPFCEFVFFFPTHLCVFFLFLMLQLSRAPYFPYPLFLFHPLRPIVAFHPTDFSLSFYSCFPLQLECFCKTPEEGRGRGGYEDVIFLSILFLHFFIETILLCKGLSPIFFLLARASQVRKKNLVKKVFSLFPVDSPTNFHPLSL